MSGETILVFLQDQPWLFILFLFQTTESHNLYGGVLFYHIKPNTQ